MKLRRTTLLWACATAGLIAPTLAATAMAQEAAPAPATPTKATEDDRIADIIVTGSRIVRPNLRSAIPIATVDREEFIKQGQTSIGDTLNDLPQLRSTFAQQNPGAGVGIAGLNLLDLRGLGTVRTLVLVNGRRHVGADILNNAVSPDVNTIATDLIERVDIVTGGNSAVYGSDAIAGVVNFVLRRNFDGIQIRGNAGVAQKGFGGNQYVSGMVGKNFADGRGNVILQGEYSRQQRVYASDIPWYRQANGLVTVDADSPDTPNATDGFADSIYLEDIRSSTTHRFGLVAIPQPNSAAAGCGRGTLANNGPANNLGTAYHCNFIFNADGTLVPQTGTRVGTGPGGTMLGGNGQTGREGTLLSILPFNERYSGNLLARFEFSPAVEAFIEAKYVRVKAVGNQLGPTFLNNSTGSLGNDNRIDPRLDNPFLNAAARTTITNGILASGCGYALGTALGTVTCRALTAAERTAIADGSYRFLFARTLTDSEDRDERFTRDTFRIVAGLRGQFNDDWRYELSVNYGKFNETADMRGFVNRQRFLLSLDAGRNPLTGAIECRAKFDPASARGLSAYTDSAATLAADIAACVPYNPFGSTDNRAAVAYFKQNIINRAWMDQFDVSGFVSGDTSGFFKLPGGPISFAVGGEYRAERAANDSDPAADNGISNSVFLGDVSPRAMIVKEGYAEIRVPLLADLPMIRELTLGASGRVSNYNTAVGTVYTYNYGGEYAPFKGLRFRANVGRAIRAPNASESLFPNVPNFANGFIDPCNTNAIGNNAIRSTNCNSVLSAAQIANLPPAGYSIGIISGSNANLQQETSDSLTLGVVFTPEFIPGFSFAADYYKIKVKNTIVTLSAQTIVNSCYDSANLSSPLCSVFKRNTGSTAGPLGELSGQILFNSLVAGPQNFAKRIREGIDFEASYRRALSDKVNLTTKLIYTHQLTNSNFENPTLPNFENRIMSELGDPQDEWRWDTNLSVGPVSFGYTLRYIGSMFTSTYEAFNPLPSACTVSGTTTVCPPLNADAVDPKRYPGVFYHNARIEWNIRTPESGRDFNLYFGVDNLSNKLPPLGTTATGSGSAIYAVRGRNFYAGFRAKI
ncbi:TonB-dependent receptor domain-containing protein [Novosphingobium aerophilum]|uniref:TonB-dependent receptor domain-containing protein n=1 Tax=Novosphingobium aerophilum TaxID=2839843 RepID=UPI001F332E57|nr:TonB-dependent receptor [Novosphingobium aerophilum]